MPPFNFIETPISLDDVVSVPVPKDILPKVGSDLPSGWVTGPEVLWVWMVRA